ncbi:20719_t:CDS:1, partial [Gigaspora margarita]
TKKERVDLTVCKAVEKTLFGEERNEKLQKQKLMIQSIILVSSEKETLEEKQLKNRTFEALNKGFHEVIWRLKCEAVAEFKDKRKEKKENF